MLMTTTALVEGRHITKYHGVVTGRGNHWCERGARPFCRIADFFGGRSGSYEEVFAQGQRHGFARDGEEAARLGANAVIGIDLDYETVGGQAAVC